MGRGDRGGSRVTENEKWISVSVGCHNFSLLRFRLHLDATPPLSPPSRLFLDFSPRSPDPFPFICLGCFDAHSSFGIQFGFVFGFPALPWLESLLSGVRLFN